MDMTRLSPSKINAFLYCGESFRLSEIERRRGLPGGPLLRGLGVHASAEYNYRHKKDTEADLPVDVVQDVARETVRREGELGISRDEGDARPERVVLDELVDTTVDLAAMYHREIARHVQPIAVEEKVELDCGQVKLVSILDVQGSDGVVADIKTAGRSKTQQDADRSLQLTFQYAAALGLARTRGTPPPPHARLDVLVATKKPKVQQLITERGAEDIAAMVAIANRVSQAVRAGIFLPVAPSTVWKCSPTYCAHFRECEFVAKK